MKTLKSLPLLMQCIMSEYIGVPVMTGKYIVYISVKVSYSKFLFLCFNITCKLFVYTTLQQYTISDKAIKYCKCL